MHAPASRTCMDAGSAPVVRRKIVVFEEDAFLVSLLNLLLHREGFDTIIIPDAQDALKYIACEQAPDLIFINHNWLLDDKPRLIKLIRDNGDWQDTPMLLLVNYYDQVIIDHALAAGVKDYILQPFDPGTLLSLIQKHVRAK